MKKRLTESERDALLYRETVYQAVRDVMLTGEATEIEREAAHAWLFHDGTGSGSFMAACELAGLDPEAVRAEVKVREAK